LTTSSGRSIAHWWITRSRRSRDRGDLTIAAIMRELQQHQERSEQ